MGTIFIFTATFSGGTIFSLISNMGEIKFAYVEPRPKNCVDRCNLFHFVCLAQMLILLSQIVQKQINKIINERSTYKVKVSEIICI